MAVRKNTSLLSQSVCHCEALTLKISNIFDKSCILQITIDRQVFYEASIPHYGKQEPEL